MCVSGYMPQKIRVGRSENLFFFFFFFLGISDRCHDIIMMHDQGRIMILFNIEVIDSLFGLEL